MADEAAVRLMSSVWDAGTLYIDAYGEMAVEYEGVTDA